MSVIKIEFPVLVESNKSGFHLGPLLFDGQGISRNRYGDGIRALQKSVRKLFLHKELENKLYEQLLWYCFSPEIKFEVPYFSVKTGMKQIDGYFAVAYYTVNQHRYACFPKLDYLTVRLPSELRGVQERHNYLFDRISGFFREVGKNSRHYDHQKYLSEKSDTVVTVVAHTQLKEQRFPFDPNGGNPFAFFSQQLAFNGAAELEKVGEDLSEYYPDVLETTLYRPRLSTQLHRALFAQTSQALVVVGKSGVGRTNLIHGAYKCYLDGCDKRALRKARKIWKVDPARVISGMSVVGQWERRFESILGYLKNGSSKRGRKKSGLPDILYVDNPVALLRVGKSSQTSLTLSHLLKPCIERRDFPIVLEATAEEWKKIQELDRGFSDLFQVIRMDRLADSELHDIYIHRRADLEYANRVQIGSGALTRVIELEPRFRGDGELPGSVLSILEIMALRNQGKTLTDQRIYETLESKYHVKRAFLDQELTLDADSVGAYFRDGLIGQEETCKVLTNTVLSAKAGITLANKPVNTMLFVGPTGVGKTEAAKLLATYLFDRQECLVRIDMNEFSDANAVERLIGSAYYPRGILTDRVRYIRSCVLLLDEIEKAHPRVHDLLLQLLDDGRLTDAAGSTTDFSQCIVVMTSNVGAREASGSVGFASDTMQNGASYIRALERFFRPEFLNRINNIELFNALQLEDMHHLAKLHLTKLVARDGFKRRNTILNIDEASLIEVARSGYDPELGARALKRKMEQRFTQLTARQLTQITSTDPIILNVLLVNGEFETSITQLRYSTAIELPADFIETDSSSLLAQLEAADDRLGPLTTNAEQDLQFAAWRLSGEIRDISQPLQRFIWEQSDRARSATVNKPVYFKLPRTSKRDFFCEVKFDINVITAKTNMQLYLQDLSQNVDDALPEELVDKMQLISETRRLLHASGKLIKRGIDLGVLRFEVLNNVAGSQDLLTLLEKRYTKLIDQKLGHVEKITREGKELSLTVTGSGLRELLIYESGIHLFLGNHFKQVPILVQYIDEDTDIPGVNESNVLEIVRLYTMHELKGVEGKVSVTDLRMGLTESASTTNQHSLLLLPALLN